MTRYAIGRRRARLAALALAAVLLLATAALTAAHPLGNFTISRYSAIALDGDAAGVLYVIDMAEIPTFQERQSMDGDGDGAVSAAEEAVYLARIAPHLAAGLRLTVDDEPIALTPEASSLTFPPGQGDLPTLRLELSLSAALPDGDGPLSIVFEDVNYPDRLGWREVVLSAAAGTLLESSVPAQDLSNQLRAYPADLLQAPPDVSRAEARYAPRGAVLDAGGRGDETAEPATAANRFSQDEFANLLSRTLDTPAALAAAMLVAVGLGAAHALTPGHGKTIVGAYLVGSRGTARHAIFLGLTTTITHTAGVFALGFLVLFASEFILPEKLYPWLGVLSGLLVVFIGASIFRGHFAHWLAHRRGDAHDHGHYHFHFGKGHSHATDDGRQTMNPAPGPSGRSTADGAPLFTQPPTAAGPVGALSFARVTGGSATATQLSPRRNRGHDQYAPHHSHDHDHSHHHHTLPADPREALRWRSLLALGISGGLLPCPSALILILSAIALRQVGVGMALIFAFSVGLAGVLTGIGLFMVYAGRFLERLPIRHTTLTARLLPMASAAFITVAGLAITWRALGEAGVF